MQVYLKEHYPNGIVTVSTDMYMYVYVYTYY